MKLHLEPEYYENMKYIYTLGFMCVLMLNGIMIMLLITYIKWNLHSLSKFYVDIEYQISYFFTLGVLYIIFYYILFGLKLNYKIYKYSLHYNYLNKNYYKLRN